MGNQQSIKKNGNHIIAWENQKGKNQEWNVIPLPNGRFLLRNPEAAKCVDIDGKIVAGSKHLIYECGKDKKSQWIEIKSATGKPLNLSKKEKKKQCKNKKNCGKDKKSQWIEIKSATGKPLNL